MNKIDWEGVGEAVFAACVGIALIVWAWRSVR